MPLRFASAIAPPPVQYHLGCTEGQRRDFIRPEEAGCVGVIARMQISFFDLSPIDDHDTRPTGVFLTEDDVNQTGDANSQAGFLFTLAHGRQLRVLIKVHEARWKGPLASLRDVDPSHQQDLPIMLDEGGSRDFGVLKVDATAFGANWPNAAEGFLGFDSCPAGRAEFDLVKLRHQPLRLTQRVRPAMMTAARPRLISARRTNVTLDRYSPEG